MKKGYCEHCDKMVGYHSQKVKKHFVVKGEEIDCEINELFCKHCNSIIFDYKNEANDVLINDEYKRKVGLLTSSEIVRIRNKYGLSQSKFADLLNIGEKTITRYENGSIQDAAYDNLIRLIDINIENFEYLSKQKTQENQENARESTYPDSQNNFTVEKNNTKKPNRQIYFNATRERVIC